MTAYLNLIGNQWLAAEDGATFAVDNPATEAHFATVSAASNAQVLQACDEAAAAQRGWRKLTSVARGAQCACGADAPYVPPAAMPRAPRGSSASIVAGEADEESDDDEVGGATAADVAAQQQRAHAEAAAKEAAADPMGDVACCVLIMWRGVKRHVVACF
jgi:lactaldehyde dehydrogenase/glycolaldehyde dehydrogenase